MRFIPLYAFVACVFLTGCVNHSKDYLKKGGEIAPLTVPSDVPVIKQQDYYPIPAVPQSSVSQKVSQLPPTMQK